MDLRFTGHGFEFLLGTIAQWLWASYLHLCASVIKQYSLIQAGKVTAGLVKSKAACHRVYDEVTCELTAKKPRSAPSPTFLIDHFTLVFNFYLFLELK